MRAVLAMALAGALWLPACGAPRPAPRPGREPAQEIEPVAAQRGDAMGPTVALPGAPPRTRPAQPGPVRPVLPVPPPPWGPVAGAGPPLVWPRGEPIAGRGRDDAGPADGLPVLRRFPEPGYDKKSDYWSPCVRDFVQLQPEAARQVLGEALSRYGTVCTRQPALRVEFRAPRAARAGAAESALALTGEIGRDRCAPALHVVLRIGNGPPLRAERIALLGDGVHWSSTRLAFADDDGALSASLPLTRELARALRRAVEAGDTVLRFESAAGYEDAAIGSDAGADLRMMLDALDAISCP